jgi:hypothetical protein
VGQAERNRAIAQEFDASWSFMLTRPNWWPSSKQVTVARLLRDSHSTAAALGSTDFIDALGSSLRRWQAFRGTPFDRKRLQDALRALSPLLPRWKDTSILTIEEAEVSQLFHLFEAIREIKPSHRKWVVTSKTLHHLLPDLIPPIDNQMTAPFLGRSALPASFDSAFLEETFTAFIRVARDPEYGLGASRLGAASDEVPYPVPSTDPIDGRIGMARVIDFAIAGFVLRHDRRAMRLR